MAIGEMKSGISRRAMFAGGILRRSVCAHIAVLAIAGLASCALPSIVHAEAAANTTTVSKGTVLSLDDVAKNWSTLTPFQQLAAADQMISGGAIDQAEALLNATQYTVTNDQITKQFFLARIAQARGQNDEAIASYRDILVQHPEFSRVRMELATTLFQTKDDEAARHHLDLVLGDTASNPNLANTVRSYINAIDGRRLWDASAYITIAPSTNFNQGSDASTIFLTGPDGKPLPFTLDKGNVKHSGIGIAAGLQASYRQPVTDQLDIIASGGINTKTFKDGDFNDALFNVTVGPRLRFDWGYLGLYGLAEQRFYANSYGGLLSSTVRLGPQDIVFGDFSCSHRDFESDWKGSDLRYQNGNLCGIGGRFEHAFDSSTLVRVLGSVGRERTSLAHLNNDTWSVGAGLGSEMPWGVSIYTQALYTSREHDGIYPGAGVRRSDDRWDFSVNLTKRDWIMFGMAPQIQYTYTLNDSTVPFFNYDAHSVNLTLTKRF
jgi:outer membrane protein